MEKEETRRVSLDRVFHKKDKGKIVLHKTFLLLCNEAMQEKNIFPKRSKCLGRVLWNKLTVKVPIQRNKEGGNVEKTRREE